MRDPILLSYYLFACSLLPAQQTPVAPLTFAVASIKPSAPDTVMTTQIRGNRFATEGTTFADVFKYAYSVHPDQLVGGPDWLRTEKFDILADPETENRPSSDQLKAMMRNLLTERFHLVTHPMQRNLPVYVLSRTTDPLRLTRSTADPNGIPAVRYDASGELDVGNATMLNLATFLQRFALDRPAIDQTGIAGHFDLVLRWTPDNLQAGGSGESPRAVQQDAVELPGLFTAMREQLGLKLQTTKANVDVFVVDHVEQPSAN